MGFLKHKAGTHGNAARSLGALVLTFLALVLPGCSLTTLLHPGATSPTAPTSVGLVGSKWVQQAFPTSVAGATPGQLAFASADVATGYACINVQPPDVATTTPSASDATNMALFTTSDSGKTWQAATAPTMTTCASSLLVAPDSANASVVFFLANAIPLTKLLTINPGNSAPMKLFRSLDSGHTWQTLPLPKPAPTSAGFTFGWNPAHVTISAHGHRIVLGTTTVGIGSIVYASTNDGRNWTTSASPDGSAVLLATANGSQDTLLALAGTDYGNVPSDATLTVWRTKDGVQWTKLATLPPPNVAPGTFAGVLLATSPDAQTVVGLELGEVTAGTPQTTQVFRSQDGGTTWKLVPSPVLGTEPLGLTTGALLGTNYTVSNDGTIWMLPIISDDYLKDRNYVTPGILYLPATSATVWQVLASSSPGWAYAPQTFFAISQKKNVIIFWTSFAASGVGLTASGIYHFATPVLPVPSNT